MYDIQRIEQKKTVDSICLKCRCVVYIVMLSLIRFPLLDPRSLLIFCVFATNWLFIPSLVTKQKRKQNQVQAKEGPAFLKAIALFMNDQGGNSGAGAGTKAAGGISYKDAGVDIDAGNALVERIKPACKSTKRAGCDSDLGGFGGLFDLAAAGYGGGDTVLVGATDGVGTKLKVYDPV